MAMPSIECNWEEPECPQEMPHCVGMQVDDVNDAHKNYKGLKLGANKYFRKNAKSAWCMYT